MKLLLTSSGLSCRPIAAALQDMLGKPAGQTKVGFVITAANAEPGNKDWVVNQLLTLWRHGYNWIDIIDPSADGVDWRQRLSESDVIYATGGNTFHLLDQSRKTGFDTWLKENLESKVYVGGSASTILMTPSIAVAGIDPGDENIPGLTDLTGLGFVGFEIAPHCDAARLESIKSYADTLDHPLYAVDDQTAIQVIDGQVSVISAGSWKLYQK